jgi:hypothetical protein
VADGDDRISAIQKPLLANELQNYGLFIKTPKNQSLF